MDRIDQFATVPLIREERVIAFVDYQVCGCCGFRLMRVETTLIDDQRIIVRNCPICQQSCDEQAKITDPLSDEQCLCNFDAWLATHGLDREMLEGHYHLKIEKFFDPV